MNDNRNCLLYDDDVTLAPQLGYTVQGNTLVKNYGAYTVTAYRTPKQSKGHTYLYLQCTVPAGVRKKQEKIEIIPRNISAPSLPKLDQKLRYIFRLDGGTPYYCRAGVTIEEYAWEWFEKMKPGWKKKTCARYADIIKNYIVKELGDKKICDLTASEVDRFLMGKLIRLSRRTVRQMKSVLRSILQSAVQDGMCRMNPVQTKLPRCEKFDAPILQRRDFLPFRERAMKTDYGRLIEFIRLSGVRISEAIGLTWDEVDFEREYVRVKHQYQQGHLEPTKTFEIRTLRTLRGPMKELLMEQKRLQEKQIAEAGNNWNNPMNLVFTDERGRARGENRVRETIKAIGEELGLENFTPHCLRRTYASHRMAETGDLLLVQEELGHAHTFTTLSYIYVVDEKRKMFDKRMEEYWLGE